MDFIKGINFAPFAAHGVLSSPEAEESLNALLQDLHTNTVILTPAGVQATAHCEDIDYTRGLPCTTISFCSRRAIM